VNAAAPASVRRKVRRHAAGDEWRILRALTLYRLFLAILLLILFESGYAPRFFDQVDAKLFHPVGLFYLGIAIALLVPLATRWPSLTTQTIVQFLVDIACVTTLVWASNGVPSGLGILLITPIVGCSLVLSARLSLLMAATSAIALLSEEILRLYELPSSAVAFTETGILGSAFLVTALATNAVAERARRSEALVARVGSDLASLTRLNERIVEQMQAGAIVVDRSHRIRLINAAARRLLNLTATLGELRLDDAAPRLAAAFVNWRHGKPISAEPMSPTAGAEEVLVRFSSLGSDEEAPALILLDEAQEARARAQQLKLAALGRLSASIAHEIRNPLAAITNAGQLLAENPDRNAEDDRLLGMIQRHSERINRIVNDILTLSRRDTAGPEVISIPEWLQRAVAQYRESVSTARRAIRIEAPVASYEILFDPNHLQQILVNLLDNAFQHGGENVAVTIRCSRSGPMRRPCLDIEDNGRGIATEMVDRIFEPFFTTAHQGTGLGLYLARELCEYNQASLSYVPRAEGGACFRLVMMEVRADKTVTGGPWL
jgi:two-component system sensor histidine kinase PilS (NtrC family)